MDKINNILIVDDKPEIAKVIKMQLSAENNVHYVENPVKALGWMQEGNVPDLIISDFYMPEMNGHEFLLYLKSSTVYQDTPVIILSSMENSGERIKMLEDGADDFILKPFNPQELRIRVNKLLKKK